MRLFTTDRRQFLALLSAPALAWDRSGQFCSADVHPFGMNYLSKYHLYQTPEDILQRDFRCFRDGGLNLVSLSLYWYRLEGPDRGVYHPQFLESVRRSIRYAKDAGLQVLVTLHTLWGADSEWCTPAYVIDPATKTRRGLAVIHSPDARQAFLDMYEWVISTLAGTDGIWGYAMLNEPWYYPVTNADRESFIALIEAQKAIHDRYPPRRPTTIRFINHHARSKLNMFRRDWDYDQRLLKCLDWVGLNFYPPSVYSWQDAAPFLATNVAEVSSRGKPVFITEFGVQVNGADQADTYRQLIGAFEQIKGIRGWMPWQWLSEDWYGASYNLWSSVLEKPQPAYDVLVANPPWRLYRGR
jgi:hypothetical protein